MRASDRAYLSLRSEILDADLTPGTVLAEVEQSVRLGVSRTPLREALSRLAAEGLVAPHSGRGVVVSAISADNVAELFELREALETQAARLAAREGTARSFSGSGPSSVTSTRLLADRHRYYSLVARLDDAIDEATGNPFLVAALDSVRTHIARIRRLSKDNPERLRDAAREHLQIVDAIVDGEESLAASATSLHLHRSLRSILGSLEQATPRLTEGNQP
ncbi:MAG: GntR family transcriptional regulator [Galbitalea sp.]